MKKSIENRIQAYSDNLMEAQGKSKTIQGEVIRAFNKIAYRHWNDGDFYFRGYGCETAGPAHSFLLNCDLVPEQLRDDLRGILPEDNPEMTISADDAYQAALELAATTILTWLDKLTFYTFSDVDMLDWVAEFQDEDDDCCPDCGEEVMYCTCDDDHYCDECGYEIHSCTCDDQPY